MPQEEVEQAAASKAEGQKQEFTFTSEALEACMQTATEQHPLFNMMALQSQIYVEGISKLKAAMQQEDCSLDKIKADYAVLLLKDLENVSKRQDVHNDNLSLPDFKSEFYSELDKPASDRSDEYKQFIKACYEKFSAKNHLIEVISAKALLQLDETNLTYEGFKQSVETNIAEYKEAYTNQSKLDHERSTIIIKGRDGQTSGISLDELMKREDLTLEQRGFIQTCWQQGSFHSGWLSGLPPSFYIQNESDIRLLRLSGSPNFVQIFIDASIEGNVTVSNTLEINMYDNEQGPQESTKPFAEGSLSVNITSLRGNSFTVGCASAKPTIQFNIKSLDDKLQIDVPQSLRTTDVATLDRTK